MKISELAAELINMYGDVEVVEIVHVDDLEASEPYTFEDITAKMLNNHNHTYSTELLTYFGHDRKKHFASANMRGYIDGKLEKAILLDFKRYIDDEE
ncbi:hypothetical protein ABE073_04585 [Lederbergia citrisecunda]|uniref:hypothetical protein n=1 Tax=Lederbergia citrisecunda TaxID=2833583 RepID=UPI003D28093D